MLIMRYQLRKTMSAEKVISMWQWCRQNLINDTWDYTSTKEPDHNLRANEEVLYIWTFDSYNNFSAFLEKINDTN